MYFLRKISTVASRESMHIVMIFLEQTKFIITLILGGQGKIS